MSILLKYCYRRMMFGLFLVLFAFPTNSQPPIESQNVEVTFNKTSSIVFPAMITSVDRGSRDVVAQKAKGVNNVLQLKAGRLNFKDTNLNVLASAFFSPAEAKNGLVWGAGPALLLPTATDDLLGTKKLVWAQQRWC